MFQLCRERRNEGHQLNLNVFQAGLWGFFQASDPPSVADIFKSSRRRHSRLLDLGMDAAAVEAYFHILQVGCGGFDDVSHKLRAHRVGGRHNAAAVPGQTLSVPGFISGV